MEQKLLRSARTAVFSRGTRRLLRGARRVDKLTGVGELARGLPGRGRVKADLALGALRRARAAVFSRGTSRLRRRSGRGHVEPGVRELARRLPRRGLERANAAILANLGTLPRRVRSRRACRNVELEPTVPRTTNGHVDDANGRGVGDATTASLDAQPDADALERPELTEIMSQSVGSAVYSEHW